MPCAKSNTVCSNSKLHDNRGRLKTFQTASILCGNTCFDKAARRGGHTPDMPAIRQADDVHLKIKLAKMSAGILNRAIPVCRLNKK